MAQIGAAFLWFFGSACVGSVTGAAFAHFRIVLSPQLYMLCGPKLQCLAYVDRARTAAQITPVKSIVREGAYLLCVEMFGWFLSTAVRSENHVRII